MAFGLLVDPLYRKHLEGVMGHPERPERVDAVMRALEDVDLVEASERIVPRAIGADELLLCHTPQYLKIAESDVAEGMPHLSTGDTDLTPNSWAIATLAAGGALNAVDAVMTGRVRNAFCAIRPPGHHATASRGMGFCLFNNIALAARYAQRKHGAERALIVDWDVHHGNGTQDIFYQDPSVFFFSTHQWPLYPGTGRHSEKGEGKGEGATMNFPFPAGSGRAEILGAVLDRLFPAMEHFRPDVVFVSAGFDSRIGDLLGQFTLTDDDFETLTLAVMELADKYAGGRVVSLLEGGYNLEGLASAATRHVATLAR